MNKSNYLIIEYTNCSYFFDTNTKHGQRNKEINAKYEFI